jgi:hypothetical protein
VILLDTSGLLAALDGSERRHRDVMDVLRRTPPPWVLSPFVLAELDYLLATRVGQDAERALLSEIGRGVYRLECLEEADVAAAERVLSRHPTLGIGLADASIVVLAAKYGVRDVLTLDQRHFRVLRGVGGRPFRILPADA